MTMTDPNTTFAVGGPGVAWRETGGEIVLLDTHGAVYFGLNPTAALLWTRLIDGARRAQLTELLQSVGPVPEDRARGDVEAFLAALDDLGFLQRR